MQFDNRNDAVSYAKGITADMRGIHRHRAAKAKAWRYDRATGDYSLVDCWTVALVGSQA